MSTEVELIDGQDYIIDTGFNNNGVVMLVSHGEIYCRVRDKETGGEWQTMSNRLSAIENVIDKESHLSVMPSNEWVNVEDRLPENSGWCNDTVLFWSKRHGFMMVGCYDYEFCSWTRQPWEQGYETLPFSDVTHWMPLPQPPLAP